MRLNYVLSLFLVVLLMFACNKSDETDNDNNKPPAVTNPCPGLESVEYLGKTYFTVLIGNQCWLRENLDAGQMINSSQQQTDNGTIEKYCYNNDVENCNKYGGLYQWDELMQYQTGAKSRGICPPGFHIPTDEEFKTLEGYLDSVYGIGNDIWNTLEWRGTDAGGKLKAEGTDDWGAPNTGATNASGFTALPHGYKENISDAFSGYAAYLTLWTSSEQNDELVWRRALSYYYSQVYRSYHDKRFGYSARCIRDE